MTVDLFSLRMNLETSGLGQAKADLTGLETSGRDAALQMTNFSNAWTAAALKVKVTGAELAAFKAEFTAGFFNEKMIAGMSLSGQEAAKAGEGARKWAAGMAEVKAQAAASASPIVSVTEGFRGLFGVVKPFVEIWAAFKFVDFVRDTVETGAALHELSQKTGASVEMLSVLQFAGKRASVGTAEIATGFRGLSLSLDGLRDGVKNNVEAFGKLGLTAKSFEGLNTDQAFLRIVEAMRGLPDGLEKSEVAARVFGRSGAALIPLLDDLGKQGFAQVRAEAEKNGGIITKQQAETLDRFSDAVGDLTKSLTGLMRGVLVPILGPLAAFVGFLASAVQRIKELDALGPIGFFAQMGKLFGKTETDWEATDLGQTRGGGQRNRGQGIIALPPPPKGGGAGGSSIPGAPGGLSADELALWAALAPYLGTPTGSMGPLAVRGGLAAPGNIVAPQPNGARGGWLQNFQNDMIRAREEVDRQFGQLGNKIALTFSSALSAAFDSKHPLKAFGKAVLAGLGSIFMQMGQAMVMASPLFVALNNAMKNPFTSGFALLGIGLAMMALGAVLGGIAQGGGGGGGAGSAKSFDKTTQITLVADGAGGFTAPKVASGPVYKVLGKNDPEGQRILGEYMGTTARRGF